MFIERIQTNARSLFSYSLLLFFHFPPPLFFPLVFFDSSHSTFARPVTSIRFRVPSIDWRFFSGCFWQLTFQSLLACPKHGSRTDVTDSALQSKRQTPSQFLPRSHHQSYTYAPIIVRLPPRSFVIDSGNIRETFSSLPLSLCILSLCHVHAVSLLSYNLVSYINQAFQFGHVKIDSSIPERKTARISISERVGRFSSFSPPPPFFSPFRYFY